MGILTFAYNDALQLESESIDGSANGLYTKTVTRTYESTGIKGRPNGFRLGSADAPEYAVTYGYDAANGRFASVSWNAGAESGVVNYSYVPNSDLSAGYTSDNGIGVSYSYEARRNLKTAVENTYDVSIISRYAYRYDKLGRRTDVVNTGMAFANDALSKYGYNDRSEVVSSDRYAGTDPDAPGTAVTDENRSYEYDPIGNRKESVAGDQQAAIYETNVLNQYTNISGAETASPAYDDDGNMTAYKDKTCTWNAENRMVSVEMSDRKVEFLYDYMGRRARKTVSAGSPGSWSLESERVFVWNGWNLVKEIVVSGGGTDKHYIWGLDISQSKQGAGGIGGLLCSVDGGAVRYFLYEANGNVGQLVDAGDGTVAAHYEYDAFGNTVAQSGAYADENSFRFSTKYFDAESGFYYYGFRFYLAELGRWLSRDPIGEKVAVNINAFINNDVINGIDFIGLFDPSAAYPENWRLTPEFKKISDKRIKAIEEAIANSEFYLPEEARIGITAAGGLAQISAGMAIGLTGAGAPIGILLVIQGISNLGDALGATYFYYDKGEEYSRNFNGNPLKVALEEFSMKNTGDGCYGTVVFYALEIYSGVKAIQLTSSIKTAVTGTAAETSENMSLYPKYRDSWTQEEILHSTDDIVYEIDNFVKGKELYAMEKLGIRILLLHDFFQIESAGANFIDTVKKDQ